MVASKRAVGRWQYWQKRRRGVEQAAHRVRGVAIPRAVQEFAGHDLDVLVDAADTDVVVAQRANHAGQVGPMVVIVHGVSGVGQEVEAVDVIDVAVLVVVDAIVGDLARVRPHIALEVWVCVVNARINDTHDHF